MKPTLLVLLPAVAAATFSLTAAAYSTPAGTEPKPGAQPMDCAKAKEKARCAALNKDIEACRDKIGDEWRACMHRPASTAKVAPPKLRDCAKARNQARCEAHNAALQACQDKDTRAEHRKCMAVQQSAAAGKQD